MRSKVCNGKMHCINLKWCKPCNRNWNKSYYNRIHAKPYVLYSKPVCVYRQQKQKCRTQIYNAAKTYQYIKRKSRGITLYKCRTCGFNPTLNAVILTNNNNSVYFYIIYKLFTVLKHKQQEQKLRNKIDKTNT